MEKFSLNWHTFQSHINNSYKELYETKRFSDVTLVSGDHQQFRAHKFILSSSSTMFQSILGDDIAVASYVYLWGVHHLELESILEFIYLGEATFNQERMSIFLDTAQDLQIKIVGEKKQSEGEEYTELPTLQESYKVKTEELNDFDNTDDPQVRTAIAKTAQSEWSCTICDKTLSTERGLIYHVESKHEGKKHECNQCDHSATNQSNLLVNVRSIHEGLKYPCNHCDYKATQSSSLRHHIKVKHMGYKYRSSK